MGLIYFVNCGDGILFAFMIHRDNFHESIIRSKESRDEKKRNRNL
jgi:hypothetical protein